MIAIGFFYSNLFKVKLCLDNFGLETVGRNFLKRGHQYKNKKPLISEWFLEPLAGIVPIAIGTATY
jgi:hypothetical protein